MTALTDGPVSIVWNDHGAFDAQAIALDENGRLDKQTLMSRLREAFNFPDYFGENWDAVYDLLLNHADVLEGPSIWRFSIDRSSSVDEDDLAIWIELMTDVCAYAESQGQPLRVVIERGQKV
ncbi:barstar family protein [Pseudomonas sp. ABC1]|uniref:barstar family protein n=1 Tax=Pseudomonas sp. ABC1 TaxID=2748080 RepID=UPI0015C2E15A|nr:barstar family protein [Pseudomonas sp. ABC1]QLF93675.1 barstar family protein [Pseudomonas sp. ABC1]